MRKNYLSEEGFEFFEELDRGLRGLSSLKDRLEGWDSEIFYFDERM